MKYKVLTTYKFLIVVNSPNVTKHRRFVTTPGDNPIQLAWRDNGGASYLFKPGLALDKP